MDTFCIHALARLRSRLVVSLALGAIVGLGPTLARAGGAPCPATRSATNSHKGPPSVRETVAVFVPRVNFRVWFRADHQWRDRHEERLARAGFEAPSVRSDIDLSRPYGWEFSLRWDLVEMADTTWAADPSERVPRPSAHCPANRRVAPGSSGVLRPSAPIEQPPVDIQDDLDPGELP